MQTGMLPRIMAVLLAVCGLGACTTIVVNESTMIPSFGRGQLLGQLPNGHELVEHEFERSDGERAYGLAVTADADLPSILVYGGNMQSADGSIHRVVDNLRHLDANLFFFDRRGQGRSTGSPGVEQGMDDAVEVLDYVREQVAGPIILHGFSLGGFEAAHVAGHRAVDAMVLEATATNVDDFARQAVPWFAKPFIRIQVADELRGFDNRDILAEYDGPLLLIAGGNDRQTSPRMMKDLYEASPSA
ncbi:alpha/beta hydrolase, partial [Natronospira sp.]